MKRILKCRWLKGQGLNEVHKLIKMNFSEAAVEVKVRCGKNRTGIYIKAMEFERQT